MEAPSVEAAPWPPAPADTVRGLRSWQDLSRDRGSGARGRGRRTDSTGRGGARGVARPGVLGAMVVGWSVVFIVLGWIRHERFATFSFDLGIYDQAIWLLSRFRDPFVT